MSGTVSASVDEILRRVADLERSGRLDEAMEEAWRAFDLAPAERESKRLVARLLSNRAARVPAHRTADLERLLADPEIDPNAISYAGWSLLLGESPGSLTSGALAAALEEDSLALLLLTEAYVTSLTAEKALTELRRWLLLSRNWARYPLLSKALCAQAALNGGAWLFDEEERGVLEQEADAPFALAYLPAPIRSTPGERFDNEVTQAVADQYVRWPYPVWSRLPVAKPKTLPSVVEKLDGGRPSGLPIDANVLIAGCGTGWEAAYYARRFPDARVTAIDLSAASLAYAEERCEGLGIEFHLLDLHHVSSLHRTFDLIVCDGVLHHLPKPEVGWSKLVEVLNPGGVMKVMIYSRVGWLLVDAAKTHIQDLVGRKVDDQLLRDVRRRLIERAPDLLSQFYDFYSLAGVHDCLLNRCVHLFDVAQIERALDSLRLELLAFRLPSKADDERYRSQHPHDPLFRDFRAWAELEKKQPFLFTGMYEFWCRRRF